MEELMKAVSVLLINIQKGEIQETSNLEDCQ